jgi:hypothetical protein
MDPSKLHHLFTLLYTVRSTDAKFGFIHTNKLLEILPPRILKLRASLTVILKTLANIKRMIYIQKYSAEH